MMKSKRQQQVAELVKRHFSQVLLEEGPNIYGREALVSVTNATVSPDLSFARLYVSVFNHDDKQHILRLIQDQQYRLKQELAQRLRKFVRKTPDIDIHLDDTIDEIYKMEKLFKRIQGDRTDD